MSQTDETTETCDETTQAEMHRHDPETEGQTAENASDNADETQADGADDGKADPMAFAAGLGDGFKNMLKNPEVEQGAKLGGEVLILPGSSLILEGDYKKGALHAGAGLLAAAAFGLPGMALVAANSFSLSRTGQGLFSNLMGPKGAPNVNLKEEVARDVAAGLTLEEITARVGEDVADMYEEAKAALAEQEQAAEV